MILVFHKDRYISCISAQHTTYSIRFHACHLCSRTPKVSGTLSTSPEFAQKRHKLTACFFLGAEMELSFFKTNLYLKKNILKLFLRRRCKTEIKNHQNSDYFLWEITKCNPRTALDGPLGFQEAEVPTLISPTHRPHLPPRKYSWYSFLLRGARWRSG